MDAAVSGSLKLSIGKNGNGYFRFYAQAGQAIGIRTCCADRWRNPVRHGYWNPPGLTIHTEKMKTTSFEEELKKNGTLCWTNVGVSMMPLLREGRDLLVIARKGPERCRRYDTILFLRPGANGTVSYIVHRILRVNQDGTYWVVGDNCTSGDIVREDQILGILTAVIRNGKREIPVTSRRYLLYVHLWCDFYPLRFFLLYCKACLFFWGSRLKRLVRKILPIL